MKKRLNNIIKFIFALLFGMFSRRAYCHEQWLLPSNTFYELANQPKPLLFSELSIFNTSIILTALIFIVLWILVNRRTHFLPKKLAKKDLNLALFFLRIGLSVMLFLCAFGLLPKEGVTRGVASLFAPDLIIPPTLTSLFWLEIVLAIFLITGIYTRVIAIGLTLLFLLSSFFYSTSLLQYSGFYFAGFFLLITQGGGRLIFPVEKPWISLNHSLLVAQLLTGLNFIYSAISVKFLIPNVDIAILERSHAFTFGIPYPKFVFIMLVVETTFGLLFILGRKLPLVSLVILALFVFLSIDLTENILAHSFIYGVLSVFLMLGGVAVL